MTGSVAYALSKKHTDMAALGLTDVSVSGATVNFKLKADGSTASVTVPTPKDGVSITDVDIDTNNHLIVTLSDHSTIDAGLIKTVVGKDGKKGDKGENGDDGISVQNIEVKTVDDKKCLITTLSDGTEINAGELPVGEGGSGDANLTHAIKANVGVGGVASGDTLAEGTSFTDVIEKMLVKAIVPTITLSSSASSLNETGTTVGGATLTLKLTNASSTTETPTKIEFYQGSTLLDTKTYVSGTNTYTHTTTDNITTKTTFSAKLYYAEGAKSVSASATVDFVSATYYGLVDTNTPDAATVSGLTKTIKSAKGYTWNNISANDKHLCYAIPTSMTALSSIKDGNNFEYLSSYTRTTVTIGGVSYYVYVLTDSLTTSGFKQIYA